ncbi:target of Nesh-SH3-like isoform X3 [Pristis pectinata]|uniref:target of Nesh-SH3-like isoform X3 n=1 Tax=Pristis pectinata TaxID=685728 RepID=UPI00223D41B4|nr:target of Nesh-SH3-like isoform X3 [Pristis pectinata]
MSVNFLFVIFGGIVLSLVDNARILPRVKRQSLKVRITAKDDSIVLQYLSTSPVIKLQGYVLGLGGRFSRQNITLPGNGDPIEVDVDFNPKYLVAVHPVAEQNNAALGKKCKGIPDLHKPPQISIDPRTPTSVYLTWANGFKDKGYKVGKECENERQYTVRYREKERDKKWKYHLCPTSETTIDNLKPNTVYEFGIRVTKAKEDGVWSKPTIYTTTMNPQPRSTKNDQKEEKLNKIEVNFNSENPKHPRKSELPGMTNIKGMTAVKQLGAPSSAHNRTNLKLLPKKPELSTKAVVGGQSTSNNADIHPEKSSSPKPAITRKPEHTRDELLDKEGIKEETTNTVSKPSLKGSKTRKENEKPAMKPLTTKESKLSSSVSPSFPSKPLFNSDRTDRKLTNSDTYAFSTAPISERGNIEDQEFKALKPTNSETSHAFSSTPKSELDNKEDKEITDYEQPTSGTPNMVSETQESALDNKDLAESDPPSDSSSIITSNPMHKIDAKQDHTGPETPSTVAQFPSAISGSTQESSPVFRSTPVSNIDGQGQERFRGPHVKYMTKINMPCSITESLKHFQEENITNAKALTAPRYPPSNLTLVTVEGCPTFLIVDWMNNENDTASEYEVVSQMQGPDNKTEKLITITNQTHAAVENLKPNTSYTFSVTPTNIHGRGPSSEPLPFVTESADPSVSEYIPGKDAIWTQYSFKFDSYSECQGKRFVKRTRYRKFVGIVLCNSLRYKIYLSNSLSGIFYNIGDLSGHGEDHCQFVDSFLDGRTGEHLLPEQLPIRQGFYRSVRQEPVMFGTIGGQTHINYVHWYECGIAIPGQW